MGRRKKNWCEEAYEAYSRVEEFKRHQYNPIEKYLAQFKSFIAKAEVKGIVYPPNIQAFKMLDRSGATDSEKQLILHGLKKNSKDIFNDIEASIQKVLGKKEVLDQCKDGLYAGYCGAIPIPGCWYWYSIVVIGVSQKSSIPNQEQINNTSIGWCAYPGIANP